MKLQVTDANDQVLAEAEFDRDPNMENRIQVMSSTGSTVHSYYDSTPHITVKVPGYPASTSSKESESTTSKSSTTSSKSSSSS